MKQVLGNELSISPSRTPSRPSRKPTVVKRGSPLSGDAYIEYRRRRLKENARKLGTKTYSTIRFSGELEIYTKTPKSPYPTTPTKSILRTKTNESEKTHEKPPAREKETMFDRIMRLARNEAIQDDKHKSSSSKDGSSNELDTQPVPPRQDWNLASLFPSSKDNTQKDQPSMVGSRKTVRDRMTMLDPDNKRFHSSDYLLKKYAVAANNNPLADMDGLYSEHGDMSISTSMGFSNPMGIDVPTTPKGIESRRRMPFSDSKLNQNSKTHTQSGGKRDKKKLSYLQLTECNSDEENTPASYLQFRVNNKPLQKGRKTLNGRIGTSFAQNDPIGSPASSTASSQELLVRKSTSDTAESSRSNRIDWGLLEDSSEIHLNNAKGDFDIKTSPRRFNWDRFQSDSPIKNQRSSDSDAHASHKRFHWDKFPDNDVELNRTLNWEKYHDDTANDFEDDDFKSPYAKGSKIKFKPWVVWMVIGVVFIGLASSISAYYLVVVEKEGRSSELSKYFGIEECAMHDHTNDSFASDRFNDIRNKLSNSLGDMPSINEQGSPQRKAMCWISRFDEFDINLSEDIRTQLVQRYSLAVIYFATIDAGSKSDYNSASLRYSNFLSSEHECDWDGILCNPFREVTILRLFNKHLTGSLPSEIGNLMSLNFIDLSFNRLTGTIPTSIQQLSSLEYLSFALNDFQTTIPTVFGQLTSLKSLNLRSSKLTQNIPTQLGELSNLELLLLDENALSGTIPIELRNLHNAEQMNFRKNNISGSIAEELCELHNIGHLKELVVDGSVDCDCCI